VAEVYEKVTGAPRQLAAELTLDFSDSQPEKDGAKPTQD
jgi:hypothetical protein